MKDEQRHEKVKSYLMGTKRTTFSERDEDSPVQGSLLEHKLVMVKIPSVLQCSKYFCAISGQCLPSQNTDKKRRQMDACNSWQENWTAICSLLHMHSWVGIIKE